MYKATLFPICPLQSYRGDETFNLGQVIHIDANELPPRILHAREYLTPCGIIVRKHYDETPHLFDVATCGYVQYDFGFELTYNDIRHEVYYTTAGYLHPRGDIKRKVGTLVEIDHKHPTVGIVRLEF